MRVALQRGPAPGEFGAEVDRTLHDVGVAYEDAEPGNSYLVALDDDPPAVARALRAYAEALE